MENSTGKPNILLIFTDQQTWNTLGVYGHPVVKTPNLDRVAARGAAFRNAFCAQPVCTPSRGSLMTGTYPHTHGSIDNNYILTEDIPTLAEILKPHGYNCGYIGKWHIGREVHPQRGFDEFWRSTEAHYASLEDREQGWYSSYHHFLASNSAYATQTNAPACSHSVVSRHIGLRNTRNCRHRLNYIRVVLCLALF